MDLTRIEQKKVREVMENKEEVLEEEGPHKKLRWGLKTDIEGWRHKELSSLT